MQSLRSRLFVLVLKNRSLLRFQRSKQFVFDRNTFLPELRKKIEDGAGFFGKLPAGFTIEQNTIENLYTEWILPPQATKGKVILYFHGGGYVTGSCQSHRAIVAKFVKGSGIGAFLFDYRLAPEHPFPAALNDATAAYRWLLDQGIDPQHIAFMGDSAGGGLCLATLLALRDQGIPTPASAVALSPWTDLKNTGESLTSNRNKDQLSWIVEPPSLISDYYRGNNDSANPWISPLYGDLHGLPPLLIFVGGDETLRDDSTRFAEKAKKAGVDITLHIGEGLFHCYPACAPLFPEAKEAMKQICSFINKRIA